jgi:hypothetical protein
MVLVKIGIILVLEKVLLSSPSFLDPGQPPGFPPDSNCSYKLFPGPLTVFYVYPRGVFQEEGPAFLPGRYTLKKRYTGLFLK